MDKNEVRMLLNIAKEHMYSKTEIPQKLKDQILSIPMNDKNLYGGFPSFNEDFAEEVDTIRSYVSGNFKKRKDGKYEWDNLILSKNESPEDFILKHYPLGNSENPFTKDLPSGDTMNVGDFG